MVQTGGVRCTEYGRVMEEEDTTDVYVLTTRAPRTTSTIEATRKIVML